MFQGHVNVNDVTHQTTEEPSASHVTDRNDDKWHKKFFLLTDRLSISRKGSCASEQASSNIEKSLLLCTEKCADNEKSLVSDSLSMFTPE